MTAATVAITSSNVRCIPLQDAKQCPDGLKVEHESPTCSVGTDSHDSTSTPGKVLQVPTTRSLFTKNSFGLEENPAILSELCKAQDDDEVTILLRLTNTSSKNLLQETALEWAAMRLTDAHMGTFAGLVAGGSAPNIKHLYLPQNGIGDAGVIALASAWQQSAPVALEKVVLTANRIGDAGFSAIAKALASGACARLARLELASNFIGSDGVRAFALGLCGGPGSASDSAASTQPARQSLTALNLGDNRVGDAGIEALAFAVANSSVLAQLRALTLERNPIGDVGVKALADVAAGGALRSLQSLSLSHTHIGDKGAQALADACGQSKRPCSGLCTRYTRGMLGSKCKYCRKPPEEHSLERVQGLAGLRELSLTFTKMGKAGVTTLAAAIEERAAFPSMKTLYVNDGEAGSEHPNLCRACAVAGIALP